jgi:hypothetical protein
MIKDEKYNRLENLIESVDNVKLNQIPAMPTPIGLAWNFLVPSLLYTGEGCDQSKQELLKILSNHEIS